MESSEIFTTLGYVNPPTAREKKTEQVGFKVEPQLFDALEAAAQSEHRKRNELARLIFEWGFEKFQEAGSFDALIGRKPIRSRT